MSAFRIKLAAVALISALGASGAHAQNTYPSLFAKQSKPAPVRTEPVRVEPVRVEPIPPAPSRVDINQQGRGNGASIGQTGPRNSAGIYQRGDNNTGQTSQTGANDSADIYQIGRRNTGVITQTGSNNTACILQVGRNNTASVIQTGNQSVGIAQTPRGTFEFPAILCQLHGKDPQKLRRTVMAMF